MGLMGYCIVCVCMSVYTRLNSMCEPLFSMVKYVGMDSCCCVTNGIVALAENGFYVGVLIKKFRYWPKIFQGVCWTVIFHTKRWWM